jgi:hypothetical protein
MRTKTAILPSNAAQTTKYVWVVVATLIVALVLWGLMAAPRVSAIAAAADDELLGANPELVYARAYGLGKDTGTDFLAANPELAYARATVTQSSGAALCIFEKDYATLAANPELVYAESAPGC